MCAAQDTCHTVGTCNPSTGTCSNPVAPDGTTCSDNNACTQTDACQSGTCVGTNPVSVDDGDPCTTDSCDPLLGVQHVPNTSNPTCAQWYPAGLQLNVQTASCVANQAQQFFRVTNTGTTPVSLSDITIKFWVNDTTSSDAVVAQVNYGGCARDPNSCFHQLSSVTATATPVSPACGSDANHQASWEIAVSATDSTQLAPGQMWDNLQVAVHLADYANFSPGTSTWYSPCLTGNNYATDNHFAVYYQKKLIFSSGVNAPSCDAPHGMQQLTGHITPAMAAAPLVGPVPGNTVISLAIGLPVTVPTDGHPPLEAFVQDVSNPNSPNYRQYLDVPTFAARYGASSTRVNAVGKWATDHNLTVTQSFANNLLVAVSGTAAAIEEALYVDLNYYLRPDGTQFYAPDREPSLDLSTTVATVLYIGNLNNLFVSRPGGNEPENPIVQPPPNGSATDNSNYYIGDDFRYAYASNTSGSPTARTGAQQCVGLNTGDGFSLHDIELYWQRAHRNSTLLTPQEVYFGSNTQEECRGGAAGDCSTDPDIQCSLTHSECPGWTDTEITQDIQMVLAMAPGVQVYTYRAPDRHRLARSTQPYIEQFFVKRAYGMDEAALERKLYVIRKRAEKEVSRTELREKSFFYLPSFSCRTIVYKGLLLAPQIANFYLELSNYEVRSALCLVHQRFSTNTFPTWHLAHPYRYICHNGEINTLRGNVNWMQARTSILASPLFGDDMKKLEPIIAPGGSDSANLDNAVELLYLAGRSLPHVMEMLIPQAWVNDPTMPDDVKAFYEYHASLMEAWDGPAAVAFTDGRVIGAKLDRNGLRPGRFVVTNRGLVIMASEAGVLPIDPEEVRFKGRLEPGRMLLVDTEKGRIVPDDEIKKQLAARQPYAKWLKANQITLKDLPDPQRVQANDSATILMRQRAFGYTDEDLKTVMIPMATNGEEPVGSMGVDTPLACLSDKPQLLFNYFKQMFAQVTNPAIDPIREDLVMSLYDYIGREGNILDETPQLCHTLKKRHPIVTNWNLEKLRRVSWGDFLATTLPMLFRVDGGEERLAEAVDSLCRRASLAIKSGYTLLILSDRGVDEEYAPIPSLLALSAVHNHLVREKVRGQVALIVETGEPREVMHFALLMGYGASAINPYLAIETLEDLHSKGYFPREYTFQKVLKNYIKAVDKGLLKVLSKMGISTLQSYCGAQIFEAIGLNKSLVGRYFTGTPSRIEGVGLDVLAREALMRHAFAMQPPADSDTELEVGGNYQYRVRGENHILNPLTIAKLQHAVRQSSFATYQEFARLANEQSRNLYTLRGMLDLHPAGPPCPWTKWNRPRRL